jgi:WD40 repeat protein/tRNA A-37 threonylcarbamoyl transferase component Bud32
MSVDAQVLTRLLHWEEARRQGQIITPEQLCANAPELLEEVRRGINDLEALGPIVNGRCDTASLSSGAGLSISASEPVEGPLPAAPGYEVQGILGRGGMGVVYKARHAALNRLVALKMILASTNASAKELARFRAEAETIARLQHPNIVQIYEIGEADGQPFLALEYVSGGSLAVKLAGTPQPALAAARLVETLAAAVHAAHRTGIIHRDLKPANVLLTEDGVPKITDFGIAKQLESDAGHTQTGAIVGTPSYMAPEQAAGQAHTAGPATDVYALGAILYECLTGRPPFKAATLLETLEQVRSLDAMPPRQLQPNVPRAMETICLKCLRKEPRKRYANAQALAQDLRRFQAGEPILARPVGRVERGWRWCRRNPGWATAASLASFLLIALMAGGAIAWRGAVREERASRERLRDSIFAQAQSERKAGNRWRALELLKQAAEMERSDELRAEAIRAIVLPGIRLVRELPYSYEAPPPFPDFQPSIRAKIGARPPGLPAGFYAICSSHDGAYAAVKVVDGQHDALQIWDISSQRSISRMALKGVRGRIACGPGEKMTSFSPDGSLLATYDITAAGSILHIWDIETGTEVAAIPGVSHWNHWDDHFQWSKDGRLLRTFGASNTGWKNPHTPFSGTLNGQLNGQPPIDFSLEVASLWELAYPAPTYLFSWPIRDLQFDSTKTRLLVNNSVRTVIPSEDRIVLRREYDLKVQTPLGLIERRFSFAGKDQVWAVPDFVRKPKALYQVQPIQRSFALPNYIIYDDADLDPEKCWATLRRAEEAQVSPDGKNALVRFDIYGEPKSLFGRFVGNQVGLAFALCWQNPFHQWPLFGTYLVHDLDTARVEWGSTNRIGTCLELWDLEHGQFVCRLSSPSYTSSFEFSPNAKQVVLAGNNPNERPNENPDYGTGATPNPDDLGDWAYYHRKLRAAPRLKGIEIREVPSGRLTLKLAGLPTDRAAFSPNGAGVLALRKDDWVAMFDIATGRELFTRKISKGTWLSFAQSPDGSYIASGDEDGTVHLWDATTGVEKAHWQAHEASVTALTFHPEGHTLVSGGADGVLKLWNLPLIRKELAELGLDW